MLDEAELESMKREAIKKDAMVNENNDKIKQLMEKMQSTANTVSENEAIEKLTVINNSLKEEISRLHAQIKAQHGVSRGEQEKDTDRSESPLIGTLTAAATEEQGNQKAKKRKGVLYSTVHYFMGSSKSFGQSPTAESRNTTTKEASAAHEASGIKRFFK